MTGACASYQKKIRRRVKFANLPSIENHDAVAAHDGVQTMSNGKHSALRKGSTDGCLDQQVR